MAAMRTEDVVALYSRYPYPSPVAGKSLAFDVANLFAAVCGADTLEGRTVLDAGCGTGQRVVGFAKQYPGARVHGIDATDVSLAVGRELAERHAVRNVTFARHDIMELELGRTFDFIISTGVVHCLQDPERGLRNLCRHLGEDGVICIWHYHPFGEFERLLGREVLMTLWGRERSDLAEGQRIMEGLQLRLAPDQYGYGANVAPESRRGQLSATADAFMHPIVNAYRFGEAMAMFRECGVDWVAINGINTPEAMKLVDVGEVEDEGRDFCLRAEDLFPAPGELRDRYQALPRADKLAVVELLMKPTGFSILAGRGDSLGRLAPRVAGNAVPVADVPAPNPRLFLV